ncbi:hypothetical protein E2C01_022807 [Portunus trituberculatus]|uniref:G-protein coupled receptors family 1 profile domain-containing protein n=1 Tax=Portunus trituberculatus TaxID=210409 RepID=A0A5B7E889_PORTR|nr:hypothetical protein [Portunus trituberculatus]
MKQSQPFIFPCHTNRYTHRQHTYEFDNTTFKCDMKAGPSKMIFYTLETPLPCLLMLMGTASIIYQVWSNKRRLLAAHMPQDLVEMRNRSTWRSTALVLCLLTMFLLCVIPNAVYNIVSITCRTEEDVVAMVTFMIYWIQYGINFILYAAGNRNFRQAYIQFLQAVSETLCSCCHPSSQSPLSSRVLSSHNAGIMTGGVSCRSIPVVRVEDVSEVTPSTSQFCEDVWNSPRNHLVSFLTPKCLKPIPFSSSSSSSSLSPLTSSRTVSLSSSSSWESSSTLVSCVSLNSSLSLTQDTGTNPGIEQGGSLS